MTIHQLAVSGYRSLQNVVLPLDRLTLVTGANGSGKSNLYRGPPEKSQIHCSAMDVSSFLG